MNQNTNFCICGHSEGNHTKMNRKAWNRLHEQTKGYVDTPENRAEFWKKYLTVAYPDEWACGSLDCNCEGFKLDNLKFLERKFKEKQKCRK